MPHSPQWNLPLIDTAGELAQWLGLELAELDWFADLKGIAGKHADSRVHHYSYRILEKRSGGIRLIEAPKTRLKQIQVKILREILDQIAPHPCAHGFVPGRSIRTFAGPHTGRRVLLRMDLRDFFPSIPAARVKAFFQSAGYRKPVSDLLGALCTNAVPRSAGIASRDERLLNERRHLPQGSPASPALANICMYTVDCRLQGLAQAAGGAYTRYADDLAFSGDGDLDIRAGRFEISAASILLEEGFHVEHRKTRTMRQGVRQHLAGLVTNRVLNVSREDFDRLKATLTNCLRHGPGSQNREAHPTFRSSLEGRVGFVESIHPARGARLRAIFEGIRWT